MKTKGLTILFFLLILALAANGFAQNKGTVEKIKVHGKSLEGNLEGDSPDRDVFVYLPPSYAKETNRRYPVVYTLHGYGLHAQQWIGFANFSFLEKAIAAG